MSTNLDVSHLSNESLPSAEFPVPRAAKYRVYFDPQVHKGMVGHAKEDTSVEICGVVVGKWEKDADGPYANVTEFIRCDDATNKFAEVTFTHESWTHINSEMDTKYPELSIVGWYHSHPDFGIFLSDRDMFIQQNFFSGPGQFAFVVDPVRDTEGLFEWRKNKAELKQHYWIGTEVRTSAAAANPAVREGENRAPAAMAAITGGTEQPLTTQVGSLPITTMLSWLCLFLMGYMLASWSSRWERETIIEGAVAHFGIYKLMHSGIEEPLDGAEKLASRVEAKTSSLLKTHLASLKEEDRKAVSEKYGDLTKEASAVRQLIQGMQSRYALSELERNKLAGIVAQRLKELRDPAPAAKQKSQSKSKTKTKTGQKAKANQKNSKTAPAPDAGASKK